MPQIHGPETSHRLSCGVVPLHHSHPDDLGSPCGGASESDRLPIFFSTYFGEVRQALRRRTSPMTSMDQECLCTGRRGALLCCTNWCVSAAIDTPYALSTHPTLPEIDGPGLVPDSSDFSKRRIIP